MEQAARAGKLHREQPFVLGVPAETIQKEWSGDETVLVQGIIDAWFEDEDGAVILVDYKTDHIADREKLAEPLPRAAFVLRTGAGAADGTHGKNAGHLLVFSWQGDCTVRHGRRLTESGNRAGQSLTHEE